MNTDLRILCVVSSTMLGLAGAAVIYPSQAGAENNVKAGEAKVTDSKVDWSEKGSNADKVPATHSEDKANKDTAKAVSRIPGVTVKPQDLQKPAAEAPIHGFHPIKKLFQPIVQLEKNSNQLQQQIMKLEGPIAGLQPPMLGLEKKMTTVEQKMGGMQNRLDSVDGHMSGVNGQMATIASQMTGVRSDLSQMHKQIGQLQIPIEDLQKPLVGISQPLKSLDQKLDKLAALLTTVLFTIMAAAVAIAIGTPMAAVLIYRNRKKLFPNMADRDFPGAKADPHPAA